jgi:hypothetical protein
MPYSEYRHDLAVTGWIVLLLFGVLAFTYYSYYNLDYFWTFILIAVDPFSGWILSAEYGLSVNSLSILIPVTSVSVWTVFRALRTTTAASRRRRLTLAALIWLTSSLFYLLLEFV